MSDTIGEEFVEDILEHYGVPGMHWGIRKGKGTTGVSRPAGALIEKNEVMKAQIARAKSGEAHRIKVAVAKAFIGEEQRKKNWNTTVRSLNAQNARVRAGRASVADRFQMMTTTTLADLVISREIKN